MTKLSEHWSDGNSYLSEGWHIVEIKSVKFFDYTSGSHGVEYSVANDAGAAGRVSFCISKPGQDDDKRSKMIKVLASFVSACGVTQEQAKAFEVESIKSHKLMVGKRLKVLSEKGVKYHEIEDWCSVTTETKDPPPRTSDSGAYAEEAAKAEQDIPF